MGRFHLFLTKRRSSAPRALSLRSVAPASYWICWVFVYLNLHLAAYFNTNPSSINTVVSAGIITYQVWAYAFFAIACLLAYALVFNKWMMVIVIMITGFFFKLLWAIALIFMIPEFGYLRLAASIGMWFSLAAIQAIVVIYLYPREQAAKNGERILNQ